MELNASDERGIDVIRVPVKNFAQLAVESCPTMPPFKLIILDEADALTPEAQAALRRTMEKYTRVTRFCLICNYVSRIIEPLASRCAKFRFQPVENSAMAARLRSIGDREGLINLSDQALHDIARISDGDMRRAINFLQIGCKLYGAANITPVNLAELSGAIPLPVVAGLMAICRRNSFDDIQSWVEEFVANGYSVAQLVVQLMHWVESDGTLTDPQKSRIAQALGKTDHRLADGADEHLQLLHLTSSIMAIRLQLNVAACR